MDGWNLLVEATITAFHFDHEKMEMKIDVRCHWDGGYNKRIIVSGIDRLAIEEMREYNIIFQVTQFGAEEAMDENSGCASKLFFLMQERDMVASDRNWPYLEEKLSLIRDGRLKLIEIEPVCGASIIVLAESIKLEAIEN
ncbi:MAG: hypothetical protein ABR889_09620 [Acidobacteriaceae bacterium]|jgi:hypothetical protein